jgi:hypothetical protein
VKTRGERPRIEKSAQLTLEFLDAPFASTFCLSTKRKSSKDVKFHDTEDISATRTGPSHACVSRFRYSI